MSLLKEAQKSCVPGGFRLNENRTEVIDPLHKTTDNMQIYTPFASLWFSKTKELIT